MTSVSQLFLASKGITIQTLQAFGSVLWDGEHIFYRDEPWLHYTFNETNDKGTITSSLATVIHRKVWRYKQCDAKFAIFTPVFNILDEICGLTIRVGECATIKQDSFFIPTKNKSTTVFNLNRCKLEALKRDVLWVTEGQFDTMALVQHGQPNVVCTLGLAYSPQQLFQLRCFASKLVLTFDDDAAGIRMINTFKEKYSTWFDLYRPNLNGKDPDEYLVANTLQNLKLSIHKI